MFDAAVGVAQAERPAELDEVARALEAVAAEDVERDPDQVDPAEREVERRRPGERREARASG